MSEEERQNLIRQISEYMHGLRRYLVLTGFDPDSPDEPPEPFIVGPQ